MSHYIRKLSLLMLAIGALRGSQLWCMEHVKLKDKNSKNAHRVDNRASSKIIFPSNQSGIIDYTKGEVNVRSNDTYVASNKAHSSAVLPNKQLNSKEPRLQQKTNAPSTQLQSMEPTIFLKSNEPSPQVKLKKHHSHKPINQLKLKEPPSKVPTNQLKIKAHTGPISTVALSPNGKIILTGSDDLSACTWDAKTGSQLAEAVQKKAISSVAFAPDGATVFIGSYDGTALLLDAETGKLLVRLQGNKTSVTAAMFSLDGTALFAGLSDGTILFWNASTGNIELEMPYQANSTKRSAVSSDKRSALSNDDKNALFWESIGSKEKATTLVKPVLSVACSPDGTTIFTGLTGGIAAFWNRTTGEKLVTLHLGACTVTASTFSLDGSVLLMGLSDGQVILLQSGSEKRLLELKGYHKKPIRSVAVSPDGTTILTCSEGDEGFMVLCFWNFETGKRVMTHKESTDSFCAAVLSSDCKSVLIGSKNGVARLCDVSSCIEKLSSLLSSSSSDSVKSQDQTRGSIDSPGSTRKSGSPTQGSSKKVPIKAHNSRISTIALSPSGEIVLTGSYDKSACTWSAKTGNMLAEVMRKELISSVAFSPDETTIFVGSYDGAASLLNAETGILLVRLEGHGECIGAATFSPDGTALLAGLSNGDALVWDTSSGEILLEIKNHRARSVINSKNTSIRMEDEEKVHLVEILAEEPATEPKNYRNPVTSVAYSPDGNSIFIGSLDGTGNLFGYNYRKKNRDTNSSFLRYYGGV